jgi:DNA-binding LacI/PurR family transcriptional regulator
VISYKTTLYGPASTLFAIERAAHLAGYHVSITSLRTFAGPEALDAVERFRMQGVAGILVIAPQREVASALLRVPVDVAVVAVESGPAHGLPLVTVDNVRGAELATSHLLSLGHATVWHVAGPADWTEAEQRIAGWRSALAAAGAASSCSCARSMGGGARRGLSRPRRVWSSVRARAGPGRLQQLVGRWSAPAPPRTPRPPYLLLFAGT